MADWTEEDRRKEAERLKALQELRNRGAGGVVPSRDSTPLGSTLSDTGKGTGITDDPNFWPKWLGSTLVGGVADIATLPRGVADLLDAEKRATTTGPSAPHPLSWYPSSDEAQDWLYKNVLPWERTSGKGPLKILEEGLKAATGGALLKSGRTATGVAANLLGGSGAEAAGQMTQGSVWEPFARFAAGVGAGTAASVPEMSLKTSPRILRERTQDITPEEWQAGIDLQRRARDMGIQLGPHEALPPGTGGGLGGLYSDVRTSPAGTPLSRSEHQRVQDIRDAHQGLMLDIAPGGTIDPVVTDYALGTSANRTLKSIQDQRFRTAELDLARGKQGRVPNADVVAIINDIDARLRSPQMDTNSVSAEELRGLRDRLTRNVPASGSQPGYTWYNNNIGALHKVLQDYESVLKSTAYEGNPARVDAIRVDVKPVLTDLRRRMMDASSSYDRGWTVYTGQPVHGQNRYDDPFLPLRDPSPETQRVMDVRQSATGQVAEAQPGTDFPNTPAPPDRGREAWRKWVLDPDNTTPDRVRRDIANMDRDAQQNALRLYLEKNLRDAFEGTKGAPEGLPSGGAGYAKRVAGSPDKADLLYTATEAVTGNATTAQGLRNFVEVVRRTGMTPGEGSRTAPRGALAKEAQAADIGSLGGAGQSVINIGSGRLPKLWQAVEQWRERGQYRELASILNDPDSLARIRQLALLNPQSAKADALVRDILLGVRGLEGAQQ